MEELKQKWDLIIQTLKEDYDITDMSFRTWIKPIQVYSVVGDKITLLIPENNNDSDGKGLSYNMRVGYIERKYLAAITLTIAEIMGREYDVTLMSSIDKEKIDKKQKQKDTSASKNNNIQNLNPNYTFETFVIGNNNNLAHAASLAVAETPGEVYNPLFIYGGVGLGKTHLMQAIAHFIIKTKPELKVLYVTSETFTNELIDSVKNQNQLGSLLFISHSPLYFRFHPHILGFIIPIIRSCYQTVQPAIGFFQQLLIAGNLYVLK